MDVWREEFNGERPHEALQGRFPRKVTIRGVIKWNSQNIFISTALAGWEVGLRVVAGESLEVWLNYLLMGSIDLQTNRFGSAPSRSAKAVSLAA